MASLELDLHCIKFANGCVLFTFKLQVMKVGLMNRGYAKEDAKVRYAILVFSGIMQVISTNFL